MRVEENSENKRNTGILDLISTPNNSRTSNTRIRHGQNENSLERNTKSSNGSRSLQEKGWPEPALTTRNSSENCTTATQNAGVRDEWCSSKVFREDSTMWNSDGRKQQNSTRSQDRINEDNREERLEVREAITAVDLVKQPRNLYIRVAAVNVCGWSDDKEVRIRQIVDNHNLDFLFVSETRKILDSVIIGKGRPLIVRGTATKTTGVAIIKNQSSRLTIKSMSPRLLHIHHPAGIEIIGVYGPTQQAKNSEKLLFWEDLKILTQQNGDVPTILIGDFNAGHEEVKHKFLKGEGLDNFQQMVKFATENNFELQEHGPTWISPVAAPQHSNTPNRTLDRCLIRCNGNFTISIETDFTLRPSDHAILSARIHFMDISRDTGRPRSQQLKLIDKKWAECKQQLRSKVDIRPPLYGIQEFWKAKRLLKAEQRSKLQIIAEDGKLLSNEEGVIQLRDMLE